MTKIKDKQLTKIREQQNKLNELLNQVGYLEAQKHGVLHEFANVSKKVEDYKKELEAEYGQVNINLETGEYTELNKDGQ
jgi:vacuolar-type H+-ATPase subunit D/Vma8